MIQLGFQMIILHSASLYKSDSFCAGFTLMTQSC